jgi:putative intracellular protease/amidase
MADLVIFPFALLWAGFSVFWEVSVFEIGAPWFFKVFGVPFVVIGLYIAVGRFFAEAALRSRTAYCLTDRRALIVSWFVVSRVRSVNLRALPKGGISPLEPRSLKWPNIDATAKAWLVDDARKTLLSKTARPDEIAPADFDAIYFTGGHAVMWDFPNSAGLQGITRDVYERGGVVSSVWTLSNGI